MESCCCLCGFCCDCCCCGCCGCGFGSGMHIALSYISRSAWISSGVRASSIMRNRSTSLIAAAISALPFSAFRCFAAVVHSKTHKTQHKKQNSRQRKTLLREVEKIEQHTTRKQPHRSRTCVCCQKVPGCAPPHTHHVRGAGTRCSLLSALRCVLSCCLARARGARACTQTAAAFPGARRRCRCTRRGRPPCPCRRRQRCPSPTRRGWACRSL